jgi:allophanate hydrolase
MEDMHTEGHAMKIPNLGIEDLELEYTTGDLSPSDVIDSIFRHTRSKPPEPVWTYLLSREDLDEQLKNLTSGERRHQALFGIPFAVKDNIDVAGHPTTAGCPDYSYVAKTSAPVVEKLLSAGAILIGKTALDQFATGTTGTRSAYGPCPSALNSEYVAGGSSSGSAVAVAAGFVSFSLGTDTAGSGRIPAAFNNIVGLKPTRGRVSTRGVVPACRSIDCIAIFSKTVNDGQQVLRVVEGYDDVEAYSRAAIEPLRKLRLGIEGAVIGIPCRSHLEFFGCSASSTAFDEAIVDLKRGGARIVDIDFDPFKEIARMIYNGPWMAERYEALKPFIESNPQSFHPVTYAAINGGSRFSAADTFQAQHRLMVLKRMIDPLWDEIDILVTPTAPRTYKIEEVIESPFELNNQLGYYTNFVNLLDLCAVAVPASIDERGLPFGISIVAPAWNEDAICRFAKEFVAIRKPL